MSGPPDGATGVKVFSICGRMLDVRQRCKGMTDWERQWRAQFLKDQVLAHDEPRNVPELYKSTTNVFRRLWKTPMWHLENWLKSALGERKGYITRHFIGKSFAMLMSLYVITYYMKYHANNWTIRQNWNYYWARGAMFPGDPGYPNYHNKTAMEYVDNGFYSSPYAILITKPPPPPPPPPPKIMQGGVEVVCPPEAED